MALCVTLTKFLIAGGLSLRRTRSASDLLERTIFRHRRSVIPFAAKQKATTPQTLKQQMRYIFPTMSCARKPGIPAPL
jgi:hypothetical protein